MYQLKLRGIVMSEGLTITILLLASAVPIRRKCTWFRKELVQDGFTLLVMEKRNLFALEARKSAGL